MHKPEHVSFVHALFDLEMNSQKDRTYPYSNGQSAYQSERTKYQSAFEPTTTASMVGGISMANTQQHSHSNINSVMSQRPSYPNLLSDEQLPLESPSLMQTDHDERDPGHNNDLRQPSLQNHDPSYSLHHHHYDIPQNGDGHYNQSFTPKGSAYQQHNDPTYPPFTFAATQNDHPNYITTIAYIENNPLAMSPEDLLKGLSDLSGTLFPSLMLQRSQQQQPLPPSQQQTSVLDPSVQNQAEPINYYVSNPMAPGRSSSFHYSYSQMNNLSSFNGQNGLPSISSMHHQNPSNNPHHSQIQQFSPSQSFAFSPQRQYYSNMHHMMIPPPSPTILSYYSANPNNWMSMASRHMYQPQAYHKEYPVAPNLQQVNAHLPYPLQRPSAAHGPLPAHLKRPGDLHPVRSQLQCTLPYSISGLQANVGLSGIDGMALPPQVSVGNNIGIASQSSNDQFAAALMGAANIPQPAANIYQDQIQPTNPNSFYDAPRCSMSMNNLLILQQQQIQPNNPMLSTFGKPFNIKPVDQNNSRFMTGDSDYIFHVTSASTASFNTSFQAQLGTNPINTTTTFNQFFSEKKKPNQGAFLPHLPPSAPVSKLQGNTELLSETTYHRPNQPTNDYYLSEQLPSTSHASTSSALAINDSFVPGTKITIYQAQSDAMRDRLLQYGHQLYSSNPRSPVLIKLLTTIHRLHPKHLPTLLLLACVHFSLNQSDQSLYYNQLILKHDPQYVEAMSNIGTTLRSMGKSEEAEEWWWRAVQLRPGYWDAVENLMGVLCGTQDSKTDVKSTEKKSRPRYKEALQLCEVVESRLRVADDNSMNDAGGTVRYVVAEKQLHRFMSLLYTRGNIKYSLGKVDEARCDYERAIEMVMGGHSVNDLLVQIASIGLHEDINQFFYKHQSQLQPPSNHLTVDSLSITLLTPTRALQLLQNLFPQTGGLLPGIFQLYKDYGTAHHPLVPTGAGGDINGKSTRKDSNGNNPLQQTNQVLSTLMLALAKIHQEHPRVSLPLSIVLPLYYFSLAVLPSPSTCNNLGIILSGIPSPPTPTAVPSVSGGSQTAQAPMGSALAMQYYTYGLSLDIKHPHLYTNLGSLLKDLGYIPEAIFMYEKAVNCNSTFDVALANLGNAVKDMGRVQDSIQWYLRAVESNPNFVEAVCGLANALAGVCDWRGRDGIYGEMATKWESTVDPNSEESKRIFRIISMSKPKPGSRKQPYPHVDSNSCVVDQSRGWMDRVIEIVTQQLSEGRDYMRHLFLVSSKTAQAQTGQTISEDTPLYLPSKVLVQFLTDLNGILFPPSSMDGHYNGKPSPPTSIVAKYVRSALELCNKVVQAFHAPINSAEKHLSTTIRRKWRAFISQIRNEGSWSIRLLERSICVIQRNWYYDAHINGDISAHGFAMAMSGATSRMDPLTCQLVAARYRRPTLPAGMSAPPVPTVLPFHTFTYPPDRTLGK